MGYESLKIEVELPDPDALTEDEVHRHRFLSHHMPGYGDSPEHKQFIEKASKQRK